MAEEKMTKNSFVQSSHGQMVFPENGETRLLTEADINRIIEMAWEDRTPFDAISFQFALKEDELKLLMKRTLKFSSYKRWRKRVENCSTKHLKTRSEQIERFKSKAQREITGNRISKKKY